MSKGFINVLENAAAHAADSICWANNRWPE
jgi:hypothetical protein